MCDFNKFLAHHEINYPNGMLDRDQRTTLTLPKQSDINQQNCEYCKNLQFHKIFIQMSSFEIQCDNCWKLNKYLMDKKYKLNKKIVNKFHKKLFTNLLVFIIVLIMSASQTEAVPIPISMDEVDHQQLFDCPDRSSEKMSKELLHQSLQTIITQCNSTLQPIRQLAEKYIDVAWSKTTDQLHEEWKNRELDWLYPNKQGKLKKAFRSKIEDSHHEHMKKKLWNEQNIVEFLKELYLRFQRISIGIGQVNKSIEEIRGISDAKEIEKVEASKKLFRQIQSDIKQLLDEIRDTILGMSVCPESEMQETFADMQREADLNHWVIYREYENLLEYSRELLRYILQQSRNHQG